MFRRKDKKSSGKYFDNNPKTPEKVFGYDTSQLMRNAVRAGRVVRALPYNKTPRVVREAAWRVDISEDRVSRSLPFAEKALSGQEITPEDVAEYRKPLKKLIGKYSIGLRYADRGARLLSLVGLGIPLRRALNRRFDSEVAARVPEFVAAARASMPMIDEKFEPYLQIVEQFENPRAAVQEDIGRVASSLWRAADYSRQQRGARGLGFSDISYGVKASTAALYQDPVANVPNISMVLGQVGARLPNITMPPQIALEIATPIIGETLYQCLPEGHEADEFCDYIRYMHHPMEGVARSISSGVVRAEAHAQTVRGAINLLPTDPTQPRREYQHVRSIVMGNS